MTRLNGVPDHDHSGAGQGGRVVRPRKMAAPRVQRVDEVAGSAGDEVRVRLRNTQAQDRDVTAFTTVSFEYQTENA